jgi:hypothetical protein
MLQKSPTKLLQVASARKSSILAFARKTGFLTPFIGGVDVRDFIDDFGFAAN